MDLYADKLNATKQHYPFDGMRRYWQEPEERAECDALQQTFDKLITQLIALGPDAPATKKIKCFKKAIEQTNEHEGVIETGEREDLCALTNEITLACGLNPDDYGDGEGLASEWREW